jgi:hypothetical protein
MVLKSTLNGDKIPICRVEDHEITLVGPDLPVKVRLPIKSEHIWRSLPEVRAAEVQCMQLSLALLARHESEMYVTIEAEKNTTNSLQSNYNQEKRYTKSQRSSDAIKKHLEECEKVFGNHVSSKSKTHDDKRSVQSTTRQFNNLTLASQNLQRQNSSELSQVTKDESVRKRPIHSSHAASDKLYRRGNRPEPDDLYHRSHQPTTQENQLKTKTNII